MRTTGRTLFCPDLHTGVCGSVLRGLIAVPGGYRPAWSGRVPGAMNTGPPVWLAVY